MEYIKYQITHFNGNRCETMADSTQPQEPILWHRDKYAGDITSADYNSELTVAGWLHEVRNLGGIAFILLRDRTGSASSGVVMAGLYYAAQIGADVVNMSLAGYRTRSGWAGNPADPSSVFVGADVIAAHLKAYTRATQYAHERGVTMIAAAANDAVDRDHTADLVVVPGDLPHVIQVSATGSYCSTLDR